MADDDHSSECVLLLPHRRQQSILSLHRQANPDDVSIVVGTAPDQHTFSVAKALLTDSSAFFRGCLASSHFPEARENRVNLPEDNGKAFEIIQTFLLKSEKLEDWTWPYCMPQAELHDPILISAYLLADKLCMEDVCNQPMENIFKVLEYCHGYCCVPHDVKHALSGAFAGFKPYDLPDCKLKEWAMSQLVEELAYSGMWHFCDCRKGCDCFFRCKCKPKCVFPSNRYKKCDPCLNKVAWQCTCQASEFITVGCCQWCMFISSDDERASELKAKVKQDRHRQRVEHTEKPDQDHCEYHVHIDTESCLEHHRPAHLVGKGDIC